LNLRSSNKTVATVQQTLRDYQTYETHHGGEPQLQVDCTNVTQLIQLIKKELSQMLQIGGCATPANNVGLKMKAKETFSNVKFGSMQIYNWKPER